MRFVKLLDPWSADIGRPRSVGEQQARAGAMFPILVNESNLRLWYPGVPILQTGIRLLLGVFAEYSIRDLRFLDIVNAALSRPGVKPQIDVFNLDYAWRSGEFDKYVPGYSQTLVSPIAARWSDGHFVESSAGPSAIAMVVSTLGLVSETMNELNSPTPLREWFDE